MAAAVLILAFSSSSPAALFDHSGLDGVLHHYVDDEGLVDYAGIRQNGLTSLESYFERVADTDFAGWPVTEKLAFWINVYNARVLYWVAQKPGMKKISEDLEMFNRPFKVAGKMLSLNDIEHRILRGTINKDNKKGPIAGLSFEKVDPRIHFALVRGALGSPPLRAFAYTAENVDESLDSDASAFANSYKFVGADHGQLQLSILLKWYAEDFKSVGGVRPYLISLISERHREDAEAVKQLLSTPNQKTQYQFDWTVNAQKKY